MRYNALELLQYRSFYPGKTICRQEIGSKGAIVILHQFTNRWIMGSNPVGRSTLPRYRSITCHGFSNGSVVGNACWLNGSSLPSQTAALEYPWNAHEASLLLSKFIEGV